MVLKEYHDVVMDDAHKSSKNLYTALPPVNELVNVEWIANASWSKEESITCNIQTWKKSWTWIAYCNKLVT